MEFLNEFQFWHWLVLGLVLIVLEVFVPSTVLLWPGIAALVVGGVAYFMPEGSWMILVLLWSGLAVGLAFGWQVYRKASGKEAAQVSIMNRRGEQYVGRHFTLNKDIVNGTGELHVDDTRWKIVSATDFTAGTKVQVTAVEGTSLRVEAYKG